MRNSAPIQNADSCLKTDWRFLPSTQLGGDAFGYHWLDSRYFAIYLLDVCGHGVGAALLSISVVNVLRSQTLPHTDFYNPTSVLKGLNSAFPMEQHNHMFFTIWYGVYDKANRQMHFSSGGHPPALLFSAKQSASPLHLEELFTPGLVIGAMPNVEFASNSVHVHEGARLLVYSDGVFEIQKSDGSMLQLEEYIQFLKKSFEDDHNSLETIVNISQNLNGPGPFQDDFSIIEISFD
jgi:sigma-B regulation protein RsbU (phosphoserine phosphatase)